MNAEYPPKPISSEEELGRALETAEPGDRFALEPGIYNMSSSFTIPQGVSLFGRGRGMSASEWEDDPVPTKTIIQGVLSSGEILMKLEDGAVIDGIEFRDTGSKAISANGKSNIVIRNVVITNSLNDAIDLDNCIDPIVENCYIKQIVDCAIEFEGYVSTGKARISNNVIEGLSATENGAIKVGPGKGDVEISGNIIRNLTSKSSSGSSAVKGSAIHIYEVKDGIVTISNNEMSNITQGVAIYKFMPETAESKVIIKNNKILNCSVFGIATSDLNRKSTSARAIVEILNNTITTVGSANAIDIRPEQPEYEWTVSVLTGNKVNGADVSAYSVTNAG